MELRLVPATTISVRGRPLLQVSILLFPATLLRAVARRIKAMSMRPNKSKTKKTTSQWVRTAPVKEPPHSDSHAHPSVQARKASSAQVLNVERFCVDLRTNLFDLAKKTTPVSASEYESEPESFSPDEDNPDDDADRYIQVISKRQKKLLKSSARARGPLNL